MKMAEKLAMEGPLRSPSKTVLPSLVRIMRMHALVLLSLVCQGFMTVLVQRKSSEFTGKVNIFASKWQTFLFSLNFVNKSTFVCHLKYKKSFLSPSSITDPSYQRVFQMNHDLIRIDLVFVGENQWDIFVNQSFLTRFTSSCIQRGLYPQSSTRDYEIIAHNDENLEPWIDENSEESLSSHDDDEGSIQDSEEFDSSLSNDIPEDYLDSSDEESVSHEPKINLKPSVPAIPKRESQNSITSKGSWIDIDGKNSENDFVLIEETNILDQFSALAV
jgi:hypothetical protein